MAVVTAVLALALAMGHSQSAKMVAVQEGMGAITATRPQDPAALQAARVWLGLMDRHEWEASWRASSPVFRSTVTAEGWAAMARRVSDPLGHVSSRQVRSDTATDKLPGAPAGAYEVIQFDTDFARKAGVIETVVLVRENGSWKVTGYFIRNAENG